MLNTEPLLDFYPAGTVSADPKKSKAVQRADGSWDLTLAFLYRPQSGDAEPSADPPSIDFCLEAERPASVL